MTHETADGHRDVPDDALPPAARAEFTGTVWTALPHVCTGRHNVPDTPDVLVGLLAVDGARRVRAVEDLYRLLLNQERVFPATAPAALVVAALLGDPRTLAVDQWPRRAGRRPLRAELLNWLASFADVARRDVSEGVGASRDVAASRAVRPVLHARIAGFCEDDDPQVRQAAVAATALLLADPALASSIPQCVPLVRGVLATSADSYYRWIAREQLEVWGEDITGLAALEEERSALLARMHGLADDPFEDGQGQAIGWLAEQPLDTAALEPPGRWHPDWRAPGQAVPRESAPEPPVAVRESEAAHRDPGRITRNEERAEWTFTPYIGVGPLHFGMRLEEITAALGEQPAVSSFTHDRGQRQPRLVYADFTKSGVRALFGENHLGCVAVNALTGPQVRLDGAPLTGCTPSRLEHWLVNRTVPQYAGVTYSPAGDPVFADLGLAIRPQRAGNLVLARPLFLLHDWLDLWHALPYDEWHYL